jgi:diguanylate cyclase (GGDEF)-like protein
MADVTSGRLYRARWAVGALTGLLLLWVFVTYSTGVVGATFSDLGETAVALLASANCVLAARSSSGRLRFAWGCLAGATLSWALGQAVWTWYELVQHIPTPFPGLADLGFLGFPLGAVFALVIFPSDVSHAGRWRMTLDGLMTACAIGLVSWATALGAVVRAGGDSPLALAVSVAYPASDIALLVVCVLVLSRSRAHRAPLAFIASGLALMAVADSGFAYLMATNSYVTDSLIDLGWFFAFGVLAFASLTPRATGASPHHELPLVAGAALPYVILGGSLGFMTWQMAAAHAVPIVEMVLFVVLVLLVFFRQFLTVRDNQKLARALALREAQLRHQAFHDPLTGLANRALFIDRATHALELHRRDRRPLAICFLDLDGFKAVNDRLGHSAGDDLLTEVARRFRQRLSKADTLARFGGDEFAVLLENQPDPFKVARALLGSLRAPFEVAGREVSVLASIGLARVDLFDPPPTIDALLMRADLAMYVVKRHGGADVLLHTDGLKLEEVDDVALGSALAQALAHKQVTVSFQPIVDLSTGRLESLEAVAQWAPGDRPISPEAFVRVAESCDLIDSLFRFVLADACAQLARWTTLPDSADLRVAVNLTPSQLSSPELPSFIAGELARHGLAGERLCLEITETGRLADTTTSQGVCDELRALGVQLSVDDFGAGRSSLARLRDLPIDEVRIDRSFIGNLDRDDARRRFVWGVVAFAERIGLTVVAEGVERQAELDALTNLGCHRAQGHLFSPPVPASTVDKLVGSPRNWLLQIPTTPPEPTNGKVRQHTRDHQVQPFAVDAPFVAEPLN